MTTGFAFALLAQVTAIGARIVDVVPREVTAGQSLTVVISLSAKSPLRVRVYRIDAGTPSLLVQQHESALLEDNDSSDADPRSGLVEYRIRTDHQWFAPGDLRPGRNPSARHRVVVEEHRTPATAVQSSALEIAVVGSPETALVLPDTVIEHELAVLAAGVEALAAAKRRRDTPDSLQESVRVFSGSALPETMLTFNPCPASAQPSECAALAFGHESVGKPVGNDAVKRLLDSQLLAYRRGTLEVQQATSELVADPTKRRDLAEKAKGLTDKISDLLKLQ